MASDFDSLWDAAANMMDDGVDDIAGDRIRYSVDGGATFTVISGFVIDDNAEPAGTDDIDETLGNRKRVKIRKTLVPFPMMTHRLQHPKLGTGTFRPQGGLPASEGRYNLFDVQKV